MKSIVIKAMLVSVALGASLFALSGTANAVRVLAEISVPGEVTVGQPVEIQAMLRSVDEGLPVADLPVTFYTDVSFGGVTGEVKLGQAVTDENGVAVLDYQPRSAGDREIRVEYVVPGTNEPEVATASFPVAGTPSVQLHHSTAGVDIPGLNVWLIIALVSTVWAILFGVALWVIAIARAGADAETLPASALPGQMQPTAPRSGASGGR